MMIRFTRLTSLCLILATFALAGCEGEVIFPNGGSGGGEGGGTSEAPISLEIQGRVLLADGKTIAPVETVTFIASTQAAVSLPATHGAISTQLAYDPLAEIPLSFRVEAKIGLLVETQLRWIREHRAEVYQNYRAIILEHCSKTTYASPEIAMAEDTKTANGASEAETLVIRPDFVLNLTAAEVETQRECQLLRLRMLPQDLP